jgi:hypothetical protein
MLECWRIGLGDDCLGGKKNLPKQSLTPSLEFGDFAELSPQNPSPSVLHSSSLRVLRSDAFICQSLHPSQFRLILEPMAGHRPADIRNTHNTALAPNALQISLMSAASLSSS